MFNKNIARADVGTPTNIKCEDVFKSKIIKNVDRLSYAPTSTVHTKKCKLRDSKGKFLENL